VQKLFDFELELYRAASVAFVERLLLFHVSVEQQVLDFSEPILRA